MTYQDLGVLLVVWALIIYLYYSRPSKKGDLFKN